MNLVILGAGNLGKHLACVFSAAGNRVFLWSRTPDHVDEVLKHCSAERLANISEIPENTHICIISVSDNAIEEVCREIPDFRGIMVHTAGSVSMQVLQPYFQQYGVLYPLQTFTLNRQPDFLSIPVFIEANRSEGLHLLREICNGIFYQTIEMDSETRSYLHLSAVFACNFVNASLIAAEEISEAKNIDFNLLRPLINETINRLNESKPSLNQTGPAMRNNIKILEKHIEMLKDNPHMMKMYEAVSQYIKHTFHNE